LIIWQLAVNHRRRSLRQCDCDVTACKCARSINQFGVFA